RLEEHARERRDKVFIESPDQRSRITFGEFEAVTRRLVNFLTGEGVRPGDRISILSDNAIEALVVFWGGLRAGVIVNPITVALQPKHASQIHHDVGPRHVFGTRERDGLRGLPPAGAPRAPSGPW